MASASFRDILADIRKRNFAPVYILMGEEPYYIDILMSALEETVVDEADREFDQLTFYGADTQVPVVMEAASRYPLMSPLQFIAFKETQSMHQAKASLNRLAPYVASPSPHTVLAISFKGDSLNATSEIIKAAKKNRDAVIFESKKIKDREVADFIRDHCRMERLTIEDKALELLAANVGASLTNLVSEIEKLKVVAGTESRITADMVNDHIGLSREFNNFELVSALARRDYFQVLNIVRQFEVNPKANPLVVSAATVFTFFQRLVLASFSADKSDRALMEILRLKTPYALKDIRTGLSFYNAAQLVKAIHLIRDFDTRSKGISSYQKEFPLFTELVISLVTL